MTYKTEICKTHFATACCDYGSEQSRAEQRSPAAAVSAPPPLTAVAASLPLRSSRCQFAHGLSELRPREFDCRYKTELCRSFHTQQAQGGTSGGCPFASRCKAGAAHKAESGAAHRQLGGC